MSPRSSQAEERSSFKGTFVLGAVAFVVALGLGLATVRDLWKPWWDSAIYLDLARSILDRGEYTYTGFPHTKYPPGFPLLLALVTGIAGEQHGIYRVVITLCYAFTALLTPFVLRRRFGFSVVVPVSILVAVSPTLLFFQTYVMSDVPFAALSLLTLIALSPGSSSDSSPDSSPGRGSRGRAVFASGLLFLCCLLRLSGIALVGAYLLSRFIDAVRSSREPVWQGFGRAIAVAAPALAFVAFWVVRASVVDLPIPEGLRESISYQREFVLQDADHTGSSLAGLTGILGRMVDNVPYYGSLLGAVFLGTAGPGTESLRQGLALLVVLGILAGFLGKLGRSGLLEWYLLSTIGLYMAWPATEDARFLVPVVPLILGFGLALPVKFARWGVTKLTGGGAKSAGLAMAAGLGLAVPAGLFSGIDDLEIIGQERSAAYMSSGVRELMELCRALREETPEATRVVSDSAPWVHYWSRRPTFSYPWVDDPEAIYRGILAAKADYVVVTSLVRPHQKSLVQAYLNHESSFEVARVEGKSVLLKVVGGEE